MFNNEKIGKDYLTIGEYFHDGGEFYSLSELLFKIESDLGYGKEDANNLIKRCVKKGFITDIGNGMYTR